MTDFIQNIDQAILLFANGHRSGVADVLMWWISNRWIWIPFYVFLAGMLYKKTGWKRTVMALLTIALLITVTDQTCATFIRPYVQRLRPSNPDNPLSAMIVILNGYRGGGYGFPSCHAANCAALAVFLSMQFRSAKWTAGLALWAFVVSWSRMYLGVHYPTDLLVGATIGGGYAWLLAKGMEIASSRPLSYYRNLLGRS